MNAHDHKPAFEVRDTPRADPTADREIAKLVSIAHRQKWVILSSVIVFLILGILFVLQSVTKYTSSTSVIIDAKQVGLSASTILEGNLTFESGAVDSQVVLLQSDRLAARVIDHLDLLHNKAFTDPPKSVIGLVVAFVVDKIDGIIAKVGGSPAANNLSSLPVDLQRNLLTAELQKNLKVTRNARTYVLTIEYTDADRALARSIAAAYASAYIEDQLESRFETSRTAANWLEERIRDVKKKADAADQSAAAFRSKNRLTEASGRLINDQSLSDANTQLSAARNDLASVQAKYDRLKQIIDSRDYAGSNVDALANPIISNLRSKYLDASKLDSEISARLGPLHESAVRARKDMAEYSKVIFQELSRLLESYQSEVASTKDRISALEKTIEVTRTATDADVSQMSKLKSLENEATTYNSLYTLYLQKAQDLVQQQSIPISDARIISDAELPIRPSAPKSLLIIAGSLVAGLLAGAGVAALREFRERGFRLSAQVRENLGLEFAAYIPKLADMDFQRRPSVGDVQKKVSSDKRLFTSSTRALDKVLDDSMSHFAESIRSIKLSIDYQVGLKRPLVIGVVSTFPNEGKSTTAKNLASLMARQGETVLLMDCDLRHPHLTRSLTPGCRFGLLELLTGATVSIDDLIVREEGSSLAFFPASARGRVPATGDILSSPAMGQLIRKLREVFGVIIVDLAPLGVVKDASAVASFVDGYHLIVEWGRTPRAAVVDALATDPIVATKILGVSLSKVEIEKLSMFDNTAIYGYTNDYMSRYYHKGAVSES